MRSANRQYVACLIALADAHASMTSALRDLAKVADEGDGSSSHPRSYSQADLPAGVTKNTYLRLCREHRVELGVVCRGNARLVSAERWAAWLASTQIGKPPRLHLVAAGPDPLREALGLVHR